MKFFKIILLILIFSSCKSFKNSFKDEYGVRVLYSEQSYCNIFEYNNYYKGYQSEKCFEIKYNFDKVSYENLKEIYYKFKSSDKKSIKKQPFYKVYKSSNKNKDTLVDNFGYGLFYVSGKVFAPNFYFLRTETNVYFYNCDDKSIKKVVDLL